MADTQKNSKPGVSLDRPESLSIAARCSIGHELRALLADVFTLYLKTKNFHWHMTGPHFRDYHLLLDEQADQLFAMSDAIAERARKLGQPAIHSIGEIAKLRRLSDNDSDSVDPNEMLNLLRRDNDLLASFMRNAHSVCEEGDDLATASLIENWIDEVERRCWFLEATTQ
jgi:starvation-inducible DNA-binding protein